MKTIAVVLTTLLVAVSFIVKSNSNVRFGVEVLIKQNFAPKSLNVKVTKGEIKQGELVQLEQHNDYLLAMRDKYSITENTTNLAEVKAFFMNEEITLEDAFALMNNYNAYDNQADASSLKPKPNDFYYAIRILTNEEFSLQDYIKVYPEIEHNIMQIDDHIFVAGKIDSYSKALDIQERFIRAGLKNNVVVAYEGTKQVPVYLVAQTK